MTSRHDTGEKLSRREIRGRLLEIHREVIEKRVKYHRAYQPISFGRYEASASTRECEDRWRMMEPSFRELEIRSLLDLGCAEGYFVTKAAECGCFAVGVDRDYNRLGLAESVRNFQRANHSAFMLADIDLDLLNRLPVFDAIVCFSVMHHIIRHNDLSYGRDILKGIRGKTGRVLFFDMGQSNEVSTTWASVLPDMGDSPQYWISDFLKGAGFNTVEKIGEADAYKDSVKRIVFRCLV